MFQFRETSGSKRFHTGVANVAIAPTDAKMLKRCRNRTIRYQARTVGAHPVPGDVEDAKAFDLRDFTGASVS